MQAVTKKNFPFLLTHRVRLILVVRTAGNVVAGSIVMLHKFWGARCRSGASHLRQVTIIAAPRHADVSYPSSWAALFCFCRSALPF